MTEYALNLREISFYTSPKTCILDSISFALKPNSITGLLGVNGAGKSTLLAICAKQLKPTTGQVDYPAEVLAKQYLGYLPEIPPLIPTLTLTQYLSSIARLRNVTLPKKRLDELLDLCFLTQHRNHRLAILSKGNRQRVGIAQAILHRPRLLLLDEPTSGLDPTQVVQFREILTQLRETTSILFSTHILSEIDTLCDQSLILHHQKISSIDHHTDVHKSIGELSVLGDITLQINTHQLGLPSLSTTYNRQLNITNILFNSQQQLDKLLAYCVHQHWSVTAISSTHTTPEQAFLKAINSKRSAHESAGRDV